MKSESGFKPSSARLCCPSISGEPSVGLAGVGLTGQLEPSGLETSKGCRRIFGVDREKHSPLEL